MKRVLFLICCVCLIICLAAPALAADSYIDPVAYIVSESANGDNNYINVRVPADDLTITWSKRQGGVASYNQTGSSASFPADAVAFDIYTNISPRVDITALVDGTTITMQYQVSNNGNSQPQAANGRWFFRYLDIDGNIISDQITTISASADFNTTYISTTLDKPDNATHMYLYFQWLGVTAGSSFTVTVTGLKFSCLVSALQRVQQETGKTNELLEKAMNGWEPAPTLPPFHDSMQDSFNKEDQIIDQLDPDGVIGDLDAIQVTVLDRILLLANSFQMISLMFQAFLKVPVIEIVAYISLLLGLLASLLGIGIAAGRAASRREGRSGKKGN